MSEIKLSLRERSGGHTSPDPLVTALYLLMRDHLPAGVLERVVAEAEGGVGNTITFSNGWLARYAQDIAHRLTPLASPTGEKPVVLAATKP